MAFRWLRSRTLSFAALGAAVLTLSGASLQGETRSSIHPYLQIEQVLSADFNGGDVLTYTGVGGGVEANVQNRRVSASVSYNYQRRISWNERLDDDDVHSGLAAVQVQAIPGTLTVDAGAMATRSHADIRIPTPGLRTSNDPGVAEIYSAYAGPSLSTHAGPMAVNASYRLGYVYVDDHSLAGGRLPPGTPRPQNYSGSTVQNATVSVGMEPGELPVGWTVGAGWSREDMDELDGEFDGRYVRADIVYPVSPTLALTAGVGYEDMEASQADIVRTPGGIPVVTAGGDLVVDPSRPRLVTYDQSGVMWDAGLIWRPGPRTELQARVGRRYGGTTFTGSLEHRINRSYALSASVYDNVSSFGRLLVQDLAGVPRNFRMPDRGGIGPGGCIFGTNPGTGACFDDALQSIDNFNFRNRGANVLLSGGRGPYEYGVGAGYSNRRYYAPPGPDFALSGVTDHSFTLSGNVGRRLTRTSGVNLDAYAAWYDSGIAGSQGSFGGGVMGNYYRSLMGDRLQANLSAGVYTVQSGPFDSTVGSIVFGLTYGF
jgi:hypothetical protein